MNLPFVIFVTVISTCLFIVLAVWITKLCQRQCGPKQCDDEKNPKSQAYSLFIPVVTEENVEHFRALREDLMKILLPDLPRVTGEVQSSYENIEVVLTSHLENSSEKPLKFVVADMLKDDIGVSHPVVKLYQWLQTSYTERGEGRDETLSIQSWCVSGNRKSIKFNSSASFISLFFADATFNNVADGAPLERSPGLSLSDRLASFQNSEAGEHFQSMFKIAQELFLCDYIVSLGETEVLFKHDEFGPPMELCLERLFDDGEMLDSFGRADLVLNFDKGLTMCLASPTSPGEGGLWTVLFRPVSDQIVRHNVRLMEDEQDVLAGVGIEAGLAMNDPAVIIHDHEEGTGKLSGELSSELTFMLRAMYERSTEDMERAAEALERVRQGRFDGSVFIKDITFSPRPGLARGAVRAEVQLCCEWTQYDEIELIGLESFYHTDQYVPNHFVTSTEIFTIYNS